MKETAPAIIMIINRLSDVKLIGRWYDCDS